MKDFLKANYLYLCLFIYVVISIISYHFYGVKVVNDTERYLEYAEGLKNGFYLDPHNKWYLGYVIFIFLGSLITESFFTIVLAQYLIGLIAVYSLFKAIYNFSKSNSAAFIGTLYFILFIEPITWHSYLLAESLLASFICILLYFVSKVMEKPTKWDYTIFFLLLIFTSLIKPTALGVFFSLAIYTSYLFLRKINLLKIGISSLILITLVFLLNKSLSTYTIFENDYLTGQVIYEIDEIKNLSHAHWFMVDVPDDIKFPDKEYPKLIQIILFIIYNPIYWLKLFSLKVFYFLIHARPYWSLPHIIHSVSFMVIGISSFLYLIFKIQLNTKIKIILSSFFIFQILAVGITTIDYDGRFIIPLIPIYALSFGITMRKFNKKRVFALKNETE